MSVRRKPVESGQSKSRLEQVLLTGLARRREQVPVGVEPTSEVVEKRLKWTVTLKLLYTNAKEGYAYIILKFGKPFMLLTFQGQLAKLKAPIFKPNIKPMEITDPDADDWPEDCYFMSLPEAKGEADFEDIVIDKVRTVANMMRTKQNDKMPEEKVGDWVVFTVLE